MTRTYRTTTVFFATPGTTPGSVAVRAECSGKEPTAAAVSAAPGTRSGAGRPARVARREAGSRGGFVGCSRGEGEGFFFVPRSIASRARSRDASGGSEGPEAAEGSDRPREGSDSAPPPSSFVSFSRNRYAVTRSYVLCSTLRSNGCTLTSMWSHTGASGGDAARSARTATSGGCEEAFEPSSAAFEPPSKAFEPPSPAAFEPPSSSRSVVSSSGFHLARTGASARATALAHSSAFIAPLVFGGGASSLASPSSSLVTPLESWCLDRVSANPRNAATRKVPPRRSRIAHRNRSIASVSLIAGRRREGRFANSASRTAEPTRSADAAAASASARAAASEKDRSGSSIR